MSKLVSSLNNLNIDPERKKAFSEYFLYLGNIYEYVHLNNDTFNQKINKNILSNIQLISKYSSVMPQKAYQELIDFFSINFQYLDKESLKFLDADLLEDIIGSKSLQVCDEDTLFEFILELYKENQSYSKLFEYVIFSNLSENLFNTFISEVSFNDLNSSIWKSIFFSYKKRNYTTKNIKKLSSNKNQPKSDTNSQLNFFDSQSSSENDDDQKSYRIVFIGNSHVGKTSIVSRIKREGIEGIKPTISPLSSIVDYKDCIFKIWDTAGQSRFQNLSQCFYKDANVFVIVYDVRDRESFSSLNRWYEISKELEPNAKYIIVANNVASQNRAVTKEEGKEYAYDHDFKYIEIDVQLNPNIWFSKLMKMIRNILKKNK